MKPAGICILGSTGSIGQSTLSVIALHPEKFKVVALTASTSIELLYEQCLAFNPSYAVMMEAEAAKALQDLSLIHI